MLLCSITPVKGHNLPGVYMRDIMQGIISQVNLSLHSLTMLSSNIYPEKMASFLLVYLFSPPLYLTTANTKQKFTVNAPYYIAVPSVWSRFRTRRKLHLIHVTTILLTLTESSHGPTSRAKTWRERPTTSSTGIYTPLPRPDPTHSHQSGTMSTPSPESP